MKLGTFGSRIVLTAVLVGAVLSMAVVASAQEPKLMAAFFVKGKVGLKWQLVSGVDEYKVFRKASQGDFEEILTVNDDHCFDTQVVGGESYTYKIGVQGDAGLVFSDTKKVTIPGSVGSFTPPVWVGLRAERDRVLLNWDPVPGAVAYNIYRSETSGGGYESVGNTQASNHADREGLEPGKTYYYVLSAMNAEFEETEYSEERSFKFGESAEELAARSAQERVQLEPLSLTKLYEITHADRQTTLNQPSDVVLNSKNQVYVSDALNGKIHCYDFDGGYLFSFGEKLEKKFAGNPVPGGFMLPMSMCIDGQDRIYVSDPQRHDIQVFTADGTFERRITIPFEEGQEEPRIAGLDVLPDGRLVVSDSPNHRLLVLAADGSVERVFGSRGDGPDQLNFPDELVVTDGRIFVVDVMNCRVQEYDLQGNVKNSFGEVGQSAGAFGRPKGIALDEKGRIWVSDIMANMAQCFTLEGEVKCVAGSGDDPYTLASPRGMFFRNGRFFVVNRVPNTVVVYGID